MRREPTSLLLMVVLVTAACDSSTTVGRRGASGRPEAPLTDTDSGTDEGESSSSEGGGTAEPEPALPEPEPSSGPKRLFLTLSTFPGDLLTAGVGKDGLESGDLLCSRAADSMMLGGTWRAWLSSPNGHARDRIRGSGPWLNMRGEVVFHNRDTMAVAPLVPFAMNERGQTVGSGAATEFWSGTRANGLASGQDCLGWTFEIETSLGSVERREGSVGMADGREDWSTKIEGLSRLEFDCSRLRRLLCVEQ